VFAAISTVHRAGRRLGSRSSRLSGAVDLFEDSADSTTRTATVSSRAGRRRDSDVRGRVRLGETTGRRAFSGRFGGSFDGVGSGVRNNPMDDVSAVGLW
jgi:hypothetical protein